MGNTEPKKITSVHINTAETWSGSEVQTFNLLQELDKRDHPCTLIAQPGSSLGGKSRKKRYSNRKDTNAQ